MNPPPLLFSLKGCCFPTMPQEAGSPRKMHHQRCCWRHLTRNDGRSRYVDGDPSSPWWWWRGVGGRLLGEGAGLLHFAPGRRGTIPKQKTETEHRKSHHFSHSNGSRVSWQRRTIRQTKNKTMHSEMEHLSHCSGLSALLQRRTIKPKKMKAQRDRIENTWVTAMGLKCSVSSQRTIKQKIKLCIERHNTWVTAVA